MTWPAPPGLEDQAPLDGGWRKKMQDKNHSSLNNIITVPALTEK